MKSTNADFAFADDAFGITGNRGGSPAEEEDEEEEDEEEEGDVTADAEYADDEPVRNVRFFFKKVPFPFPFPRNVSRDMMRDLLRDRDEGDACSDEDACLLIVFKLCRRKCL